MIVLVPVSRFRVKYEVAAGYPYSELERLVLQSVGEGVASIAELVKTFQVHPRLLIQSLVTLTHAGWVALGSSAERQFVLTRDGQQALEKEQIPESIQIEQRKAYVLMERVTGMVLPEGEAQYVSKSILLVKDIWKDCPRLPSYIVESSLDESQVQHLLPRQQGQRLHWIGPIEMASKGAHFIPVDVDPDREVLVNLPQRCDARLRPVLLDKAREFRMRLQKEDEILLDWEELVKNVQVGRPHVSITRERAALPPNQWKLDWSSSEVISGRDEHNRLLREIFQRAKDTIYIASAAPDPVKLDSLKSDLVEALDRGVNVDLLFGSKSSIDSVNWVKKTAYDTQHRNELRSNRDPIFSNSRFVLWNEGDNTYRAVVGTNDWLAEQHLDEIDANDIPLSLQISHPGVLSALSWFAAALWSSSRSEALSSVPDKWRRIASQLETKIEISDLPESNDSHVLISVILDRDHSELVHDLVSNSRQRLLITTSQVDAGGEAICQSVAAKTQGLDLRVFYGSRKSESESSSSKEESARANGIFKEMAGLVGNILISDNSFCVSSANLLHYPELHEKQFRDLGILIQGSAPTEQVATRLLTMIESMNDREVSDC